MNRKTRKTGRVVKKVFEMLWDEPEGLPIKEICERLQPAQLEDLSGSGKTNELNLQSFERLTFGCVAAIKAGWLRIDQHQWSLSAEGRSAYTRYEDPETFMAEAAKHSARGWFSVHFPHSYMIAGRAKDRITSEYRVARRIGIRRLVKEAFGKAAPWQEILPIQAPLRILIEDSQLSACESIVQYLNLLGVPHNEGGHAVYLPPESLRSTAFGGMMSAYPANAGMKIAKDHGGIDESSYVNVVTKGDSHLQLKLIHDHKHLTLVANFLHSQKLGPRLYDLIELQQGDKLWAAYIIEHISGGVPSMSQCEAGIRELRELDKAGAIKVIPREGFDDQEFKCPSCSNNALIDQNGEFRYIDFQNFFLANYESFLKSVAIEAAEKTHFGDTSVLRGGRYLYQSVPGVGLPGKRGIDERISVLKRLMDECNVSVKDRLVLDIGCNIGMMIAQYLKLGASWCHGWDRAYLTPHTEKLLLALGCTRFSTSGVDIAISQPLEDDLPPFLRGHLDGCAISYLAVRGHLGWLDALARIPWKFMIYEGHEGETQEDFGHYVKQFSGSVDFKIGGVTSYVDGDSDARTLAILLRN